MNIALLCSGPSLCRLWSQAHHASYDIVIAVNRAGWLWACDWLAFVDRAILDPLKADNTLAPRIGYITHANHILTPGAQRMDLPWYGHPNTIPETIKQERGDTVCAYTTPSALFVALRMAGADGFVDIYGMDCNPLSEADCGGWTQAGSHGSSRWLAELPWLRAVRAQHADVSLHIHGPCPLITIDYINGKANWEELLPVYGHIAQMGNGTSR